MNDMNILTVNGEQYNVADKTAREKIANDVANVIKETVTGATVSTDMVSPIEHDVGCKIERINLFNVYSSYDDMSSSRIYRFKVKPNTDYICSSNEPSGSSSGANIWFNGPSSSTDGVWNGRTRIANSGDSGDIYVDVSTTIIDKIQSGEIWVMINKGGIPSSYTPYIPDLSAVTVTQNPGDKTFKPNAEGIVTGVKSIYPSMAITTDNPGTNLEVTYNVDTKKYVESKQTGFDIVDSLPTANEENYKKAKLYLNGGMLSYMMPKVAEERMLNLKVKLPYYGWDGTTSHTVYKQYIYLIGGDERKTIIKYDTKTDTAVVLEAQLPAGVSKAGAATIGSNIYIFGGFGSSYLDTIYKFDCITETVEELKTKIPQKNSKMVTLTYGDEIYLFGGNENTKDIYKFSPKEEIIEAIGTIPASCYDGTGAVYGTSAYIIANDASCYKFDFNNNSIEKVALDSTMPMPGTCSVMGNKLYLFGFRGTYGAYQEDIRTIDLTSNHLELSKLKFPEGRMDCCSETVENEIYILGGYIFNGDTNLNGYKIKTVQDYAYTTLATTAQTTELTNAVLSQGGNV